MARPAEELHADGLEIRRYEREDAPRLHTAIIESIEHLRPWMPWVAAEPLTLEQREELIMGRFDAGWSDETDFGYGLFVDDLVVGGCGLHRRIGTDGLEIGYWVHVDHIGRGFATAAAGALCSAAFALDGIGHVEIHHDKANARSRRVPEKLGFALVREVPDDIAAPAEIGISCEWRLDRPD
jgi:ribosomal-protein-serine acetyltransferase